jgi:hypothetical protein
MRSLLISLLFCFVFVSSYSQYDWDFGVKLGAAAYLGDIGGKYEARPFIYDVQLQKSRQNIGGFVRKRVNEWLYISAGLEQGTISGADSLSELNTRFSRNLSFRNHIVEASIKTEFNFITLHGFNMKYKFRSAYNMYVFTGFAMFFHNPKANYNGQWYALQPLQTEGVNYSRIQPAIPLGGGMHYTINKTIRIGWEIGWRMTFTDYLDDVSGYYISPNSHSSEIGRILADRSFEIDEKHPNFLGRAYYSRATESNPNAPGKRGNADNNDSYFFTSFSLSYVIRGSHSFHKRHHRFKTKIIRVKARF